MDNAQNNISGMVDTPRLLLEWKEAPWDSVVLGSPVLQILRIEVRDKDAGMDMSHFEADRNLLQAGLVSCRMSCDQMHESILLEERGFRFVEMLYQPELLDLSNRLQELETGLIAERATQEHLPTLEEIAGHAFRNERFHVDPRLGSALGDRRYRNWVHHSLNHESQRLLVIRDGDRIVAFFVTEMLADGTAYWHLNAVAPEAQGRGYGKRAWRLMIQKAHEEGVERIRTSIVARNHRVLNLYARLGFHFPKPLMTFHWVKNES